MNRPPLGWHENGNYLSDEVREAVGGLTTYLTSATTDPLWLQLDENSRSGWNPQLVADQGWELSADEHLIYPGLPPLAPAAYATHLGEKILVYPHGWVVIVQLGGAFSVARVS
jgi:hypothetical protein